MQVVLLPCQLNLIGKNLLTFLNETVEVEAKETVTKLIGSNGSNQSNMEEVKEEDGDADVKEEDEGNKLLLSSKKEEDNEI